MKSDFDRCKIHLNRFPEYNELYDACYCKICDKWLEGKCEDPNCWLKCYERPDKPSQLYEKKMDEKIKSAKKLIDDKMNGLLKEDKKLDKKRDKLEDKVKRLKKNK